ncbi:MAG: DUF397 domain-containing protein [Streptosporangiales bacterium]|jgi:hypothetical protein|nr:DUF397 domain-containing protein [Streptosporangiales bacterium]
MEGPGWRKSSYSGSNQGNCVELGQVSSAVLVRDTADRDGVTMIIDPVAWRFFMGKICGYGG